MSAPKKEHPLYTIITVTKNNFEGLKKTAASIDKQNFDRYEWLVIDGESTDGSVDFLRDRRSETRSEKFPFRFISEADEGIYDAMNKGIEDAQGRFLLFLNAGDQLASEKILETLAPYADKLPDFIYGDALEPTGNRMVHKYAKPYKDMPWGMITHHQAMLYNRLRVRDLKMHYSMLYDIASDYDFTLRFLRHAKKILYAPMPICIFEQGGISQKDAKKGRREQLIIRDQQGIVSMQVNVMIYTVQALSQMLFRLSPALHRSLREMIRGKKRKNKKAPPKKTQK